MREPTLVLDHALAVISGKDQQRLVEFALHAVAVEQAADRDVHVGDLLVVAVDLVEGVIDTGLELIGVDTLRLERH